MSACARHVCAGDARCAACRTQAPEGVFVLNATHVAYGGGTSFKVLFADSLYLIGAGCYQIFNLDDFSADQMESAAPVL